MVPADSRRISRVPRYSGYRYADACFAYGIVTLYDSSFQKILLTIAVRQRGPTTQTSVDTTLVWARPRSLATTRGIINLFSLPTGTKMFQFPALASLHGKDEWHSARRVVPFGNRRITGYLLLPDAYRSLSRPSSPPRAKASAVRP